MAWENRECVEGERNYGLFLPAGAEKSPPCLRGASLNRAHVNRGKRKEVVKKSKIKNFKLLQKAQKELY